MGHQCVGRDRAQTTGLEVLQRLDDLSSGVHDEWPVVLDTLSNGFAAQYEDLEVDSAGVLAVVGPHAHPVSSTERHELTALHRSAFAAHPAGSGQDVHEAVEAGV